MIEAILISLDKRSIIKTCLIGVDSNRDQFQDLSQFQLLQPNLTNSINQIQAFAFSQVDNSGSSAGESEPRTLVP